MSRVMILEPHAGISGDMLLGALLDVGASLDLMNAAIQAATGGRAVLRAEEATRAGIRCIQAKVVVDGRVFQEAGGPETCEGSVQDPVPSLGAHHPWKEIDANLSRCDLTPNVRKKSRELFRALAEAEAKVHGQSDPESVHFHEVGSLDAVADIVGSVAGMESLDAKVCWHTPPKVGGGTVSAAHGRLPVPAPATLELLRDRELIAGGDEGELVTPTGAALLRLFSPLPLKAVWTPEQTGYGAGAKNPKAFPNVLRLSLGKRGEVETEVVDVIEASLDDCTPEEIGYWIAWFLDHGALDATAAPLVMKKGRPGFLLRVLGEAGSGSHWAGCVTEQTTSLGARWHSERRWVLPRRVDRIQFQGETIRIKVAEALEGERPHVEFEDLARVASKTHRPIMELRRELEAEWFKEKRSSS